MLGRKYSIDVDTDFSFFAAHSEKGTGYNANSVLTGVHAAYWNIVDHHPYKNCRNLGFMCSGILGDAASMSVHSSRTLLYTKIEILEREDLLHSHVKPGHFIDILLCSNHYLLGHKQVEPPSKTIFQTKLLVRLV